MQEKMIIQGTCADIDLGQRLIADHPNWHSTRVSQELCRIWDWHTTGGQIKEDESPKKKRGKIK